MSKFFPTFVGHFAHLDADSIRIRIRNPAYYREMVPTDLSAVSLNCALSVMAAST
jgi:hypothetical protein